MRPSFAVIPTHNRPAELAVCVAAISPQVDHVLVIDNASTPPVSAMHETWPNAFIWRDTEQPPNLSRLWNIGLNIDEGKCRNRWPKSKWVGSTEWDVAVLNDDAIPPPGWMAAISSAMRETGAVAGCSSPFDGPLVVHHADAPPGVNTRLTGWAFVLRGESGLRFDETMRWWFADDDLSMRARQSGGLVHVPGFPVPNTLANTSTNGVLAAQSAVDAQTFFDKWGTAAW